MKQFLYVAWVISCMIFSGCSQESTKPVPVSDEDTKTPAKNTPAEKPLPTIEVYTLGTVRDGYRDAMIDSLKKVYPKCRFVSNLPLPRSAWYEPRKRFLADSLTNYLGKRHNSENIVVGITEVDISMPLHGQPNYGIMGFTNYFGGGVCVFSTFRKKDRSGMFSLMKHELGHAFGLRHCKTSKCLMHAAEGTDLKGAKFCPQCAEFLKSKGWNLVD